MVNLVVACAEIIRIILSLTRPFSDKILDVLYAFFMGRTKPLPPIDNKVLLMSATQLAERIRKRQLSCEEVMKAYIKRVRQVQPLINAAVDERLDEALTDAIAVDRFLASGQKTEEEIARETPLLGVPFSCKEVIGVKGMACTVGLVRARDNKAERDSETAALYRKAGAIPIVVTNVPELCMWWDSANLVFGKTKNPYDNARNSGGSSGGEGAIITSAGSLIGIGNDIGGSIRIPSAFCGIYGHKPSRGVISNDIAFDLESPNTAAFVSTGPMCRYAEDLPLLLRTLSDGHNRLRLNEKVDFRKIKVYYMEEIRGTLKATSDVKACVRKAAKYFEEEYGISPVKLNFDEMRDAFRIWGCKILETGGLPFKAALTGKEDSDIHFGWEFLKKLFHCCDHTLPAIYFGIMQNAEKDKYYYEGLRKYDDLKKKFDDIFQDEAVLLIPTHGEPPPHTVTLIPKFPNIAYTCIFNILGFPCTHIPAGLSIGLPIGIQAVSGQYQDHLTVATALELDKVFNGWVSPCPITV